MMGQNRPLGENACLGVTLTFTYLCSPQKVFCVWILNYFKKRDEQRGRGEENVRQ